MMCSACRCVVPPGFISRGTNICVGCRSEQMMEWQRAHAERTKAISTTNSHATRAGMPVSEFAERYGWDYAQMEDDIKAAFAVGVCPECERPYDTIHPGLPALSIDIVDPEKDPTYGENTRWVCRMCNSSKQRATPQLWEERKQGWRIWRANREKREAYRYGDMPLFAEQPAGAAVVEQLAGAAVEFGARAARCLTSAGVALVTRQISETLYATLQGKKLITDDPPDLR